jgi:hypothetical protein
MKDIIFKVDGRNGNLVSLLLRAGMGICLFTNHGWEKIHNFSAMRADFPDPIHIGSPVSFYFAFLVTQYVLCSLSPGCLRGPRR